jgi:predicted regulator of Ras-like GTPase activity (Roadblock/LC7/MglB family)
MAEKDLTGLLKRLTDTVPDTRSAVLLSTDGLAKSWHGLETDGADQLAAMASSLCSLAQQVGTRFGGASGVRQVVAELGDIILFVTAASTGTVLAVLAGKDVDAGVLSYEMARLSTQLPSHLATPIRHAATNRNR